MAATRLATTSEGLWLALCCPIEVRVWGWPLEVRWLGLFQGWPRGVRGSAGQAKAGVARQDQAWPGRTRHGHPWAGMTRGRFSRSCHFGGSWRGAKKHSPSRLIKKRSLQYGKSNILVLEFGPNISLVLGGLVRLSRHGQALPMAPRELPVRWRDLENLALAMPAHGCPCLILPGHAWLRPPSPGRP